MTRSALRYLGCRDGAPTSYFTGASLTLSPGDLFEVPPEGLTLGRRASATLRVASAVVAPAHVRVTPEEGGLDVVDLGSTNGTAVNGVRVMRARATAGDRITLAEAFDFEVVALP